MKSEIDSLSYTAGFKDSLKKEAALPVQGIATQAMLGLPLVGAAQGLAGKAIKAPFNAVGSLTQNQASTQNGVLNKFTTSRPKLPGNGQFNTNPLNWKR